jgi:hypothetical protein
MQKESGLPRSLTLARNDEEEKKTLRSLRLCGEKHYAFAV